MPNYVRSLSRRMFFLFILLLSKVAWAGSITSSLNRTEAAVGEVIVMTVTIEGASHGDLEAPQVDGLVIEQRGVSRTRSYVNGQTRQELSINFLVQALKEGTFTIPSMSIELDGKKESSLPLTITIGSTNSAQIPKNKPTQQQTAQGKNAQGARSQNDTGILVERECAKPQVFVGEQVICSVRIYHRGNLAGGQRLGQNSTDYRRFSIEGEKQYQKVINGQRYAVIELKEIIVPLKEGRITVAPFELDARVISWNRRGNPLDKFFDRMGGGMFNFDMSFTEETQALLKSDPTALEVQKLPAAGRSDNFSGLVGQYQISAQKSTDRVAAGDTVTITINLEGIGLLDTANNPTPDMSKYGKIYADKPEYKEQLDAESGIRSAKIFKYALVPNQPGTLKIPPVEISVFNPRLGQYVELRAELGDLIVSPANAEQKPLVIGQQNPAGTSQQSVKSLDQDLLGLHREENLSNSHTITKGYLFVAIPMSVLSLTTPLIALAFTQWQRKRTGNTPELKRTRAYKTFRTQVDMVQKDLGSGQVPEAFGGAYLAFRNYLGDKCGKQGAALTARDIDGLLSQAGATKEQRDRAHEFVSACEKTAFGGILPSRETAKALTDRMIQLIEEVERA